MPSAIQQGILEALLSALRPIARFLLRAGIGYREFSEICKIAFVQVATKDYGIRGRPTNVSRVAVMTGLTRKEVKRLRDEASGRFSRSPQRRSPPADVLHFWYTDPDFLTPDRVPKELPYDGHNPSFCSLVKRAAGDIPPGAMRTELKRIGAVAEHANGLLTVNRRDFVPENVDERLIEGINFGLRTLASTIAFNSDPALSEPTRYQKVVNTKYLPPDKLPDVQDKIRARLSHVAEGVDDLFSTVEERPDPLGSQAYVNVGMGLYFFVDED
jgi:hypothetical protein